MRRSSSSFWPVVAVTILIILISPVFGVSATMMDADGNEILDMDNFSAPFDSGSDLFINPPFRTNGLIFKHFREKFIAKIY
jgi:hypothetical protein